MYFLNFFPLEEQYSNNAKTDELIIDPRTGHVTICTSTAKEYASSSKGMESDLNGLLSLKDKFYNEYLLISDELEDVVNKLLESKDNINKIIATITECRDKLNEISGYSQKLLEMYDSQYKRYNRYLYNEMEPFRSIVRENTKKVIIIENLLDELFLLGSDVESIRKINKEKLNEVKKSVGLTI